MTYSSPEALEGCCCLFARLMPDATSDLVYSFRVDKNSKDEEDEETGVRSSGAGVMGDAGEGEAMGDEEDEEDEDENNEDEDEDDPNREIELGSDDSDDGQGAPCNALVGILCA